MAPAVGFMGGLNWLPALIVGLAFLLAVFLIPAYLAHKAGRSGWWIYAACSIVAPVNLVLFIAYFVHLKDHPKRVGRWVM